MTFLSILTTTGIGVLIGLVSYVVFKERGIKLLPSVIVGGISGTIGGLIPIVFGLVGSSLYAAVASVAVLFTFNVFRTKEEPVFGDP